MKPHFRLETGAVAGHYDAGPHLLQCRDRLVDTVLVGTGQMEAADDSADAVMTH